MIGVPFGAAAAGEADDDAEPDAKATGASAVTVRASTAANSPKLANHARLFMPVDSSSNGLRRGHHRCPRRMLLLHRVVTYERLDRARTVYYCFTVRSMPLYHFFDIAVSWPSACIVCTV